MNSDNIPVIDLFAGPGGLGEGFSSYKYRRKSWFRICLSIEKDHYASRTLRLRSFFRKFPFDQIFQDYVEFAKSKRTEHDEQRLFSAYPLKYEEIMQAPIKKHSDYGTDWYFNGIIKLGGRLIDKFNLRV